MAKFKLSWQEKLDKQDKRARDQGYPKLIEIEGKMSTRWDTGTCVIPAPREVDEIMKGVPGGKLITINQTREIMAKNTERPSVDR